MLSPKETWDLFMKQPYTKTMREDDINFLNDVLRDDADLNSQFLMEAAAYYGRCPCMTVLKSMSDVKLSSKFIEFNQRMESYFGGKVNKAKTKIKETPKTKSSKK